MHRNTAEGDSGKEKLIGNHSFTVTSYMFLERIRDS